MIGLSGRQGPAATLRQHCPQMTRRRCRSMHNKGRTLVKWMHIQYIIHTVNSTFTFQGERRREKEREREREREGGRHCTPNCVPLASRLGGKFEHKLSSKQSDVNKCLCLASLNTSATQPLGQRDAIRCMEDEKPTRMIFSPGPLFFITHDFLLFDVFFVHLSAASSPSLLVSL